MFDFIPGQDIIKQELITLAREKRIPHALLFVGPQGNGGLALAIAFAQYILCQNPNDRGACGSCTHCKRVAAHVHPDIHYSFPVIARKGTEGKSAEFLTEWRQLLSQYRFPAVAAWTEILEADNKQLNINRKECSEIISRLSLKPVETDYKIQIIWLPEYLGKEGNRLLKLIEEPPPNTFFFLVAQDTSRILPTILSRCQIIRVPAIPDETMAQYAIHALNLPSAKAATLAALAEGDLYRLHRLATEDRDELEDLFIRWVRLAFHDNKGELVKLVETIAAMSRERQKQFIQTGIALVRLMIRLQAGSEASPLSAQATFVQKMASFLGFEKTANLVPVLDACLVGIQRNAYAKILFLDTSFRIRQLMHAQQAETHA